MWRAAVLVGRSISDLLSAALCVAIVALTGLAIGWRPDASFASVSAASPWPCSSPTPCRGSRLRRAWSARARSRPQSFGLHRARSPWPSSPTPWCPPSTCPDWLQAIADWNPVSAVTAGGRAPVRATPTRPAHPGLAHAAPGGGRADLVGGHPGGLRPAGLVLLPAPDHRVAADGGGRPHRWNPGGSQEAPPPQLCNRVRLCRPGHPDPTCG